MLSLLAQGNTGAEILSILNALVADNVSSFDYIESPLIESILGISTLDWYNSLTLKQIKWSKPTTSLAML